MTTLSFVFEGAVAALMIALIVYCVRLDRRLRSLRENDGRIRELIGELRAAADRAEAAVGHLKSAGLEAERSLNQAIRTAQAVEDDLLRRGRSLAHPPRAPEPPAAPAPARPVAAAPPPAARPAPQPAAAPPRAAAPQTRIEAERDLLNAIRVARTEGQA